MIKQETEIWLKKEMAGQKDNLSWFFDRKTRRPKYYLLELLPDNYRIFILSMLTDKQREKELIRLYKKALKLGINKTYLTPYKENYHRKAFITKVLCDFFGVSKKYLYDLLKERCNL
jgi:hypothetical protein